jgi:hypothetical protein
MRGRARSLAWRKCKGSTWTFVKDQPDRSHTPGEGPELQHLQPGCFCPSLLLPGDAGAFGHELRHPRRPHSAAFDPTASARAPQHDPPRPRCRSAPPTRPRQGFGRPGNRRPCPDPPAHRYESEASPAPRPRLNPQGRRPSCGFVQRSPMGTAAGLLRCSPPASRSAAPPIRSFSSSDVGKPACSTFPPRASIRRRTGGPATARAICSASRCWTDTTRPSASPRSSTRRGQHPFDAGDERRFREFMESMGVILESWWEMSSRARQPATALEV